MKYLYIIIFFLALLPAFSGCNTFDPGDVRNNINDPGNVKFIPDQPSNISLTKTGDLITIEWKDNTDFEDAYLIKHSTDDSTSTKELAKLPSNSTSYEFQLKEQGFILHITVEAITNNGQALPDSTISKLTSSISILDIRNLNVSFPKENLVNITWDAPLGIETAYKIYMAKDEQEFQEISEIPNNGEENRLFALEKVLATNTLYKFKVVPINDSIIGRTSSVWETVYHRPSAPGGISIDSESKSSVQISWDSYNTEPLPVEIIVDKKSNTNSGYTEFIRLPGNSTKFTDSDLGTSQTYTYRIRTLTSSNTYVPIEYTGRFQNTNSLFKKSGITDIEINPANQDLSFIFFDYKTNGSDIKIGEVWNLNSLTKRIGLGKHTKSIEYNSNGSKIITTNFESVKIFDAVSGEQVFSRSEENKSYFDAAFSFDDNYFAIGGSNLTVWNSNDYSLLKTYSNFSLITGIQFHPKSAQKIAFTTHNSNNLVILNGITGEIKQEIAAPEEIEAFSFSTDGNMIATFLFRSLILWNADTGERIQEWSFDHGHGIFFYNASEGIQFLRDNKILVGDYLLDIELGTKERIPTGRNEPYDYPREIVFNKDETRFYVAYETIEIWDLIRTWYRANN